MQLIDLPAETVGYERSMAYVPGYKHDCFLGYAHKGAAWVSALQEQLTERLLLRLGSECEIWHDKGKLYTVSR